MPFDDRNLDDYVDVNTRIADFRELHPAGFLQPLDQTDPYRIVTIESRWCRACIGRRQVKDRGTWKTCGRCQGTGLRGEGEPVTDTFIVCVAAAYREPGDTQPGIGMAWEPYPGQTPYTLGSELMNAETSAWGRAIVAVLASDSKRGIASREEARNRRAEQEEPPPEETAAPPRRKRESPPPRPKDELPRNQDGAISRGKTTDEEKAAAGIMTDEQQGAHNALERDILGVNSKGKTRNPQGQHLDATPEGDQWLLPPYEGPDSPQTPVRMPRAAQPVDKRIIMHFDRFGITDRDVRLGYTALIAGRDSLGSTKELTAVEGLAVEKALARCKDREAFDQLLDRGVASDAG